MAIIERKTTVNLSELAAEVNRRLGKSYSINYIANIHSNRQSSKHIKECIDKIISEQPTIDVNTKGFQTGTGEGQNDDINGKAA